MAWLVPAIHVFLAVRTEWTWMPGARPGMTSQARMPDFIDPADPGSSLFRSDRG
jgi:hypothetical protein